MPLAFDGTQPITGQVSLTGAQVGLAEVTVDLQALVGGNAVDLGSTTGSALLDPTATATPVPFSITPNTSLDGSDIQALDLRVTIHGPNIYSGFVALSGASYVDLPSYAASVNKSVLVSLDDPYVRERDPGPDQRLDMERRCPDAGCRQTHRLRGVDSRGTAPRRRRAWSSP